MAAPLAPAPGSVSRRAGNGGAGDRASLSGLLNILGPAQTASARAWPVIASGFGGGLLPLPCLATAFADIAVRLARQMAAERSPGGDLASSGRVQRGSSGADHGF